MKHFYNIKGILGGLVLLGLGFSAGAQQDYHFSQFFAAPITYNPATAGAFEADVRGSLVYRNQWSSVAEPYTTYGLSADMPLQVGNSRVSRDFIGIGLSVVNDKAGTSGFNTLNAAANVSYAIDLGGTEINPHFVAVGLQFGFLQRSTDLNKVTWENQWNGTGFNQGVNSGEPVAGNWAETDIDLGGGITYFYSFNDYTRMLVGGAVLHANKPKSVYFTGEEAMMRKFTLHGSMAISQPDANVTYLPHVFVMFQGPYRIIDVGSEIEFSLWERTEFTNFKNNLSTNIGAYYRYKDAMYLVGRVNYYDFSIGISYDFTLSGLNNFNNGNGGVELVLGYRTRFSGPGAQRQRLMNSKGL